MLEADFDASVEARVEDFSARSFLFRAACRVARLLAPVQ
jgi:hypothetical protein